MTSATVVDRMTAIDEIAATIEARRHWVVIPVSATAPDQIAWFALHALADPIVWIDGGDEVLRSKGLESGLGTVLGMLPIPTVWVLAIPKTGNTVRAVAQAIRVNEAALSRQHPEKDVICVHTSGEQSTDVPTLWIDALQRVQDGSLADALIRASRPR